MRQRGVRGNADSILAQNDPFVTFTVHLCLQLATPYTKVTLNDTAQGRQLMEERLVALTQTQ